MGDLLRRGTHREWDQSKRKKCVAVNKEELVEDLKNMLTSGKEMQSLRCLVLLWSRISSLSSLSSLLEWKCISCAIICCKYVICYLILILQGITVKRLYKSQKIL